MSKGKYSSKNGTGNKKRLVIGICGLILAAVLICMIGGRSSSDAEELNQASQSTESGTAQNEQQTDGAQSPETEFSANTAEEENLVLVTTQYGTVTYPAAFSDVIQIRTEMCNNVAVLKFEAQLDNAQAALFDICYGEMDGDPLTQIVQEDGTVIKVYMEVYQPPVGLNEDDINTFYAAQEVLNDVLASMQGA